jgi:hypothetical protein
MKAPHADPRAAWLALTAPGLLVSRSCITLALLCAPLLTPIVYVEGTVRRAAAALLLAHLVTTGLALQYPGRSSSVALYALLGLDALLCGALLGVHGTLLWAGVPLALLVLALGLEAAGPAAVVGCTLALALGAAASPWFGITRPLVFAPAVVFPTFLSVESSYAGAPVIATDAVSFPTVLSVEPTFGGAPAAAGSEYAVPTVLTPETEFAGVSAVGSSTPLVVPAVLLVLGAITVGCAVSLWRVRRVAAVASSRR